MASTDKGKEEKKRQSPLLREILESQETGYRIIEVNGGFKLIAYGYSPGFETYSTRWYCLIEQQIKVS